MKRCQLCWTLWLLVFILAGTAWAADRPASSDDTPAILASLDADDVTILDDQASMAIRGQEYKYVLVKILGINALDGGAGIQWTWNPLGYRYGAWGGPGWSNGGLTIGDADAADPMDAVFKIHDLAYMSGSDKLAADQALLLGLLSLVNINHGYWGWIYDPVIPPLGLTTPFVQVSGVSLFGNRFFFGWRPMPYTEYARREALAGLGIMIFARSLVSSVLLQ